MPRVLRHYVTLTIDGETVAISDRERAILNALWLLLPRVRAIPAGEVGIRWRGDVINAGEVKEWIPEGYFTEAAT